MGVQSKIDNKQEEFIRITILTTALQSIIIFCNAAAAPSVAAEAAVLNSQFAIWNVKAAADAASLGSEDRSRVATDYTAYNARHPYPTRIPITTHQARTLRQIYRIPMQTYTNCGYPVRETRSRLRPWLCLRLRLRLRLSVC